MTIVEHTAEMDTKEFDMELTIKPRTIDIKGKGSLRVARQITSIGYAAKTGDPTSFDEMVKIIIQYSDILIDGQKPDPAVNLYEVLYDELPLEEAQNLLKTIAGRGNTVSPTKGNSSKIG